MLYIFIVNLYLHIFTLLLFWLRARFFEISRFCHILHFLAAMVDVFTRSRNREELLAKLEDVADGVCQWLPYACLTLWMFPVLMVAILLLTVLVKSSPKSAVCVADLCSDLACVSRKICGLCVFIPLLQPAFYCTVFSCEFIFGNTGFLSLHFGIVCGHLGVDSFMWVPCMLSMRVLFLRAFFTVINCPIFYDSSF